MKNLISELIVILLLAGVLTLAFSIQPVKANSTTIVAPDNYPTIQKAIDYANEGDTIYVKSGVYNEHVVVNKSLTLVGEDKETTVVDGGEASAVIHVTAKNVTVKGFTIRNGMQGVLIDRCSNTTIVNNIIANISWNGIMLARSVNSNITENIVRNNYGGIWIDYSSYATLRGNVLSDNNYNLMVYGRLPMEFTHDIDTSNSVDGKPIYYLMDKSNLVIDASTFINVGYLALIQSTNITVRDLHISNNWQGLLFAWTTNSRIINMDTSNNGYGMYLYKSTNNEVDGNIMANNLWHGIELISSSYNTVTSNVIVDNDIHGIWLASATGNTIINNTVASNFGGICAGDSDNNIIYDNSFVNNTQQIVNRGYAKNLWDNGYPCGGNFWSNYTGVDLNHDGIGDSPHVIDADNQDKYPLMGQFSDFNALGYRIQTICNSTISDFQFNGTAISFNVFGENSTIGFCRICVPTVMMNGTYRVFVNGSEVSCFLLPCSSSTYSYLYFTFHHSTLQIVIIPEFPLWFILLLFMMATLMAVLVCRRRHFWT